MASRQPESTLSQTQSARDNRRWYWANHEHAKAKKRAAMQRYRDVDPAKHRAINKRSRANRRDQLLAMYGSVNSTAMLIEWLRRRWTRAEMAKAEIAAAFVTSELPFNRRARR